MPAPHEEFHGLGPDRDSLKTVKNERLSMILQTIAVGSMLVLAMAKATHVIKDLLHSDRHGRSK